MFTNFILIMMITNINITSISNFEFIFNMGNTRIELFNCYIAFCRNYSACGVDRRESPPKQIYCGCVQELLRAYVAH